MIRILQHLGMGDYIICNSLIKELILQKNEYTLISNIKYKKSIEYMYQDVSNLTLEFINLDVIWNDLWNGNKNTILSLNSDITIGFKYLQNFINITGHHFDEIFYKQFNIPFNYRWDKFKIKRNVEFEFGFFKQFNIKEKEYVFLHDTPEYKINRNLISSKFIIIEPIPELNNIFDYCYLLENAKEIHCIDSSFKNLADSINVNNVNLYYHYNRQKNNFYYSSNKHDWVAIKYNI